MELEDILVGCALPLHPYPRLSVGVKVNGKVRDNTPLVLGDPDSDIWEMSGSLKILNADKQASLTIIACMTGGKETPLAEFDMRDLSVMVKAQPNLKYYELSTCDSCSSIQLIMSCSVKVLSSPMHNDSPRVPVILGKDPSSSERKRTASREDLETKYADIYRLGGRNVCPEDLRHVGHAYVQLYEDSHDITDLDRAVNIYEEAVQFTCLCDPQLAKRWSRLTAVLWTRFDKTGNSGDLDRATALSKDAVKVTNDDASDMFQYQYILGRCCLSRHQQSGVETDLIQAISALEQAFQLMRVGDPSKYGVICNLMAALHTRYDLSGSLDDLTRFISFTQKVLASVPNSLPEKPGWLHGLGDSFQLRFDRTGNFGDLEEAIGFKRAAVNLIPDGHHDKPRLSSSLGSSFHSRFERFGYTIDLENAISFRQAAVDLMPDGHHDKPSLILNLGNSIYSRFQRFGNIRDLAAAITTFQVAVDTTPDGGPGKAIKLNSLAVAFQSRFDRIGDINDLEKASSFFQAAVNLTPDGNRDKPEWINNLGSSFLSRFNRLGEFRDLERAISLFQEANDLTPAGHPDKPYKLANVGSAIQSRFQRFGDIRDLETAISTFQMAVDSTRDGHPNKAGFVHHLGASVQLRFDQLGDIVDEERGISLLQVAVDLTPDGHPSKARWLNNLGTSLKDRFHRNGDIKDLQEAASSLRLAASIMSDGHPDKPAILTNLGRSLEALFDRLGNIEDLERAISFCQDAVDFTPDGHHYKPSRLYNVGICLKSRFERYKNVGDIERSISFFQKAVDLTPDGHPEKIDHLQGLGKGFLLRFGASRDPSDLKIAISTFSIAATSPTGPPNRRFDTAHCWVTACLDNDQPPLVAFECAINLLPRLAWLGMSLKDQHARLIKAGNVVRHAVAVAIKLQEYEIAVQWAEYGRAIVWQNLLVLRSPLDQLHKTHPELAIRLRDVSKQLERSISHYESSEKMEPVPLKDIAHKASTLATERDEIIEQVRRIPGFEYFLKPKVFEKLTPAAYEGPVVIINTSVLRCDALVLIPHDSSDATASIVHIPLETFSDDMSRKLFQRFSRLLSSAGVRARDLRKSEREPCPSDKKDPLGEILFDLWVHVVKPILDGLAYQSGNHSRIWWCATGSLAFLPIHAAGNYDSDKVGDKISDYVVSSYTPSLTAILDQSQPDTKKDFQILTVAQPSTPRAPPLPATEREVKQIHEIAKGIRVKSFTNEEATVARVLQAMKESNWIHLACHGTQDGHESMKSGFLLHDDNLELSKIIREPLPKADFAFLSACQTATGDQKVAQESAHLAAGMLFSGCKGVIATMWSIQDDDAPKITEAVYRRMLKDGKPNRKEAAWALHEAVKELRESGASFLSWVPFIHMGR
ncbi:hypothetical protein M408DRAFT_24124 [Serendipita vermifera MAFF 305830]|uniref:CHAT domain-containing protein n=1 Tax=Serendipita vermifera MAFF 305830 TaxID=933852 RepID=A0A0C3AU97_SERVB|nr:hypothetical protein M408DRAFT_24124 [Serendipita vermifera MAFF 305830]